MNVLIVNFALQGLDPERYRQNCEQIAPSFAELPGLIAKTWIANPETNTYGGLYLWSDREALENYLASDTFKALEANPYLTDITTRDFAILDEPTRITRGVTAGALQQAYRQPVFAHAAPESRWPLGGFPGRP